MKFRNRSDYNRGGFASTCFTKTKPKYGLVEKNGKMVVDVVGETNVYQQIQEAAPDTCLQSIINRLTRGDTSAVGNVEANFVDVTAMPKTLMEAQNLMIFSENYFKALPVDVKQKYNNNLNLFLQEVDKLRDAYQRAEASAPAPATAPAPVENKSEVSE